MLENLLKRNRSAPKESAIYRAEVLTGTLANLLSVQLNERELLQNIVDSVVDKLGFRACMMALVQEQDGERILRIVAYKFSTVLSSVLGDVLGQRLQGSILEVGERIAGTRLMGNYVKINTETAQHIRCTPLSRQ